MSSSKTTISWFRIGAEGVVIVVSILFAFAVDAWWADRQDRRTERDDLERLHAEFTWNRDRVNDNGTATRAQVASAEIYELVVAHLGRDEPLGIPNDLINDLRSAPTFDPATPVLDGLILSGGLSNIRDPDVLSAVALWQRHITQVSENELGARAFTVTQLSPALFRRGNLGPSYSDAEPDGTSQVMVDEELVGLIAYRAGNTRFVLRSLDRLKTTANGVIVAIEKAQSE